MSSQKQDPEAMRRRLRSKLPFGYEVAYDMKKESYVVRRGRALKNPGREIARRHQDTVEKWRDPSSTMAFVVRDAERRW